MQIVIQQGEPGSVPESRPVFTNLFAKGNKPESQLAHTGRVVSADCLRGFGREHLNERATGIVGEIERDDFSAGCLRGVVESQYMSPAGSRKASPVCRFREA